jgi:hypothetical protein
MKHIKLFEEIEKYKLEDNSNFPKLDYIVKEIIEVDSYTLEEYFKNIYDLDYDYDIIDAIQPEGTFLRYNITGVNNEYAEKKLSQFIEGKGELAPPNIILNDLAKRGFIPKGNYFIILDY